MLSAREKKKKESKKKHFIKIKVKVLTQVALSLDCHREGTHKAVTGPVNSPAGKLTLILI